MLAFYITFGYLSLPDSSFSERNGGCIRTGLSGVCSCLGLQNEEGTFMIELVSWEEVNAITCHVYFQYLC